jgi:VCBS repeat-containing protein
MNARRLVCLLFLASLSACGGGGDKDNERPSATGTSITTNEDQPGSGTVTATDPEGQTLSATIGTAPARGTATVTGGNPFTVTYTPSANQNGTDSFTVIVADTKQATSTVAVSVTIVPVQDAPVLNARNYTANEDAGLGGNLTGSDPDSDPLVFSVSTAPAHGTLTLNADGAFTYVPAANYHGPDSFVAQVSDGGRTSTATMSLAVTSVNDPVVVAGESAQLPGSGPGVVDVLANDSDVDGDPLTLTIESQPSGAVATIENNQVRIAPAAGMAGPTRMTYRVSDGAGSSAVATLDLLVGPVKRFYFVDAAPNAADRRIWVSNYLQTVPLETPVPAGETLAGFATSADTDWIVYVTNRATPLPNRHRLWLKHAGDASVPVVEIPTGNPSYNSYSLKLSPDGTLVAFNDRVASTATPAQSQPIDANVAYIGLDRPMFTRDSRQIFYVTLPGGGSRIIHRADVSAAGAVSTRTQMTATYQPAEGLGIRYGLSPDESLIVSLGLILPVGSPTGIQQNAFVTTADGSMNDARLHPLLAPLEGAYSLPVVSADNRFGVYEASLGGIDGLYSTDLQSPGAALLLANTFIGPASHQIASDARTMFYPQSSTPGTPPRWFRTRVDTAGAGVAFAPVSGAPDARQLAVAADGSAVVFDGGSQVYATLGAQFTTATSLLTLESGSTVGQLKYASDWNAVVVLATTAANTVTATVVNPKAPGWSMPLVPLPDSSFGADRVCIAFAGEGC